MFARDDPDTGLIINAAAYGVIADDGQDDSATLQQLVEWVSAYPDSIITLPQGSTDLYQPLVLNADKLSVKGQGQTKTRLYKHFHTPQAAMTDTEGKAIELSQLTEISVDKNQAGIKKPIL